MFLNGFTKYGYRNFFALGEYFEGTPKDISLKLLLNLHDENITPLAKNLLETDQLPQDVQLLLTELTRGIRAFSQFQDILDVSINVKDSEIINRHYAYFESLIYLRESVISCLNRNVLAALTLLRPFLELTIIHLYWLSRCELENSYKPYYEWLKVNKLKLSFNRTLNYVIEHLPSKAYGFESRLLELKQVIRNIYKTLCPYHHTAKMEESITAKSGSFGEVSLEIFFYYLHVVNILLRQVVYLFILSYPMSLFPVERYKKWGFSGPVGIFFDYTNFALIEHYIGTDNISVLKDSLKAIPHVQSSVDWFDSFPDLTPDEIESDWQQFEKEVRGLKKGSAKDLREKLALAKSVNRGISWALNYVINDESENIISDEAAKYIKERIKNW